MAADVDWKLIGEEAVLVYDNENVAKKLLIACEKAQRRIRNRNFSQVAPEEKDLNDMFPKDDDVQSAEFNTYH